MDIRWSILKSAFKMMVTPEARRFERALNDPKKAQTEALQKILMNLRRPFQSVEDFQNNYEISGEEQLAYLPQRLKNSKVIATETTSGSSGKAKEIPYTASLMASFHHMFRLWAWDVLNSYELRRGVFFFSISPQAKDTDLKEDSDYLQSILGFFLKGYWAVDAKVLRKKNPDQFMKNLSIELLKRRDLEIISVWSPSYLLTIFKEIEKHKMEWSKEPSLSAETRLALSSDQISWMAVWPELRFVSLWGSAFAATGFEQIKTLLPAIGIQAKGLLATEAPLTIPWTASGGFVPLVEDIFFEFLSEDGSMVLLHELQINQVYEVFITTPGGLLRYRLGDKVRALKSHAKTPCLEFIGRAGDVSDLVGEKLSEWAARDKFAPYNEDLGYYLLVPDQKNNRYILYSEKQISSHASDKLDRSLQEIFHYGHARDIGQLQALQSVTDADLRRKYFSWREDSDMRLGDIKEKALLANLAQAQSFLKYSELELQPS